MKFKACEKCGTPFRSDGKPTQRFCSRRCGVRVGDWCHYQDGRLKYAVNADTGCWEWFACLTAEGYGTATYRGKSTPAHLAHWRVVNGQLPKGTELDHLCRNPKCVRLDHLEPVSHAENMRRGAGAKLTAKDAALIRRLYFTGRYLQRQLAEEFGVHPAHISRVCSWKLWRVSEALAEVRA